MAPTSVWLESRCTERLIWLKMSLEVGVLQRSEFMDSIKPCQINSLAIAERIEPTERAAASEFA